MYTPVTFYIIFSYVSVYTAEPLVKVESHAPHRHIHQARSLNLEWGGSLLPVGGPQPKVRIG